jgi:hypothetical protein
MNSQVQVAPLFQEAPEANHAKSSYDTIIIDSTRTYTTLSTHGFHAVVKEKLFFDRKKKKKNFFSLFLDNNVILYSRAQPT